MSTYIGPITNSLVEESIKEIKKKVTREKIINHIIKPLTSGVISTIETVVIVLFILLVIIIILLSILVYGHYKYGYKN
jgi:uncharacterized membrane protein